MGGLSRCIAVAIVYLALTHDAGAQQTLEKSPVQVFRSGLWTGFLIWDEQSKRAACQMSGRYHSGVTLSVIVTFDGWWGLKIDNKAWLFDEDGTGTALLTIDNTPLLRNKTTITRPNSVMLPIGKEGPALQALRRGHSLEFQTTDDVVRLALEGTNKAIGELKRCIETEGREYRNRRKPAAPRAATAEPPAKQAEPPAETPAQSIDYVEREKTIIFISSLLTRAGLSGFQLEASDDDDPSIVNWNLPSGVEGSVSIAKAADFSVTAFETLSSRDVAGDAKICSGQFTSGLRPKTATSEVKVRHMFTHCDDAEASFSRSHVYALNDKFVVSMGLLRKGEEALDERTSELDADLINHADWTLLD